MTIEERAEKITEEVLGDFATSFLGYIDEMTEIFCKNVAVRMAKEQKAIDIDNHWNWIKAFANVTMGIDISAYEDMFKKKAMEG